MCLEVSIKVYKNGKIVVNLEIKPPKASEVAKDGALGSLQLLGQTTQLSSVTLKRIRNPRSVEGGAAQNWDTSKAITVPGLFSPVRSRYLVGKAFLMHVCFWSHCRRGAHAVQGAGPPARFEHAGYCLNPHLLTRSSGVEHLQLASRKHNCDDVCVWRICNYWIVRVVQISFRYERLSMGSTSRQETKASPWWLASSWRRS